ncbi:MAG: response regulator [Verrucomicrobiales bacterium]|nr:response regulator [Verrucomicrobiales bacterium]
MSAMKRCVLMMADDDPDDREFVREAFDECGFEGDFRYVEDGADLVDYLTHSGRFEEREEVPVPDLILLDLNMPRMDGKEALAFIKSREELRRIPIVVLSTSDSEEDIRKTYDLGVNSFVTKPSSFDEIVKMAQGLHRYWFEIVQLPRSN